MKKSFESKLLHNIELQKQYFLKKVNKIFGYINDISIIFLTIFMGILIGLIFIIKG